MGQELGGSSTGPDALAGGSLDTLMDALSTSLEEAASGSMSGGYELLDLGDARLQVAHSAGAGINA